MRLCIHRGARQIGGSCVELEHDGHSILLDLGLPLDADGPDPSLLPDIPALTDSSASYQEAPPARDLAIASYEPSRLLGVVVSHIHPDHIGLTSLISPKVPVYVGEKTWCLMRAAKDFLPRQSMPHSVETYHDGRTFQLGPFRITPYLVDHSAFDAYGLLVEAGNRRIFYSGDFRAHGRKSRLMERFIQNPPSNIDVLLLEGTTLSRSDHKYKSEMALEKELTRHIATSSGLVLAVFSAQNIDRFVSVYKATLRADRVFVGDAYLAHLLRSLGLPSLPSPNKGNFRVYLPNSQRGQIFAKRSFEIVEPFRHARIFADELAADPSRFVVLFRESMAREFGPIVQPAGADLIYSLWPGYLDRDKSSLRAWCEATATRLIHCHTSGHADPHTLIQMAQSMSPRHIIPIHTEAPDRYRELFANVTVLNDGQWFNA